MNMHMQRQTTGMPHMLKDEQCIQQITRPRMGKKRKHLGRIRYAFFKRHSYRNGTPLMQIDATVVMIQLFETFFTIVFQT